MERIDKVLSYSLGVSRKDVKSLLQKGKVSLDGVVCKKSDIKIDPEKTKITVEGKEVLYKKNTYLMLNKPKGYVSATNDKKEKTVLNLVPPELLRKDMFPAGRLDKDTTGFVLLTDDGNFAHEILSPKKHVTKEYIVTVDGKINDEHINLFRSGAELKSGEKCLSALLIPLTVSEEKSVARIIIKEGMYHQIKRMFGSVGLTVTELKRIKIGSLSLDENLEEGKVKELSEEDLEKIKTPCEEYLKYEFE